MPNKVPNYAFWSCRVLSWLVGHWAVMGRARTRQVAFIKGFGFVPWHIYWNWLVARLKGDQRRAEERRKNEEKGGNIGLEWSGTISDLWKCLESKNRYFHSLRKKYPCQNQRGREREREIDNLYWQDSAEERLYINILISVSGCSHFKAAWVDLFEISPALKILPNYSFPGCGSWRDLRTASTPLGTEGLTEGIIFASICARWRWARSA